MRISEVKKQKISEQILAFLFESHPKSAFTSHIAREIARDEEFVKKILNELKTKKLVTSVLKNNEGIDYVRRIRWRLSDEVYLLYKSHQR